MVIYTKNAKLKKEVFKKIGRYDKMAIKAYKQGNIKKGKYYEKLSDKVYKKNYSKIFKLK